jgi:hypothetical protein
VANKEQKRSTREAKKPKQKKKEAEKRPAGKGQAAKPLNALGAGRDEPLGRSFARHLRWAEFMILMGQLVEEDQNS